ncbi:RNA-directed DNA polymerase, eukaryota, reverse transcriptase zinc-binding domain protein, partial [Tanacetum coccineum]
MIFKVDFEKAFHSVRWDCLDDILKSFGFGDTWRSWISGCLNSAKGPVLINGSPTPEFQFHKGLKQGDPLSPFLFILAMESLHRSFSRVMEAGFFKGIGVSKEEADLAASIVGCSILSPPFHYLGVKIGASMSRIISRLALLKSVLKALSLYYMSIYKAPAAVLKDLESIPIHGVKGNIDDSQTKISGSIWQELVREFAALKSKGIDCVSFIKQKLGNGENTLFWEDIWLGDFALKMTHPRLFALELKKDTIVAEKMGNASLNLSFRRLPRSGIKDKQYKNLVSITSNVLLLQMHDRWSWSLNASGDFMVRSVRNHMNGVLLPKSDVLTRWVTIIPIKINIVAWKISMDRLPTRFNLSSRGLEIQSILFGELVVGELVVGELVVGDLVGELMVGDLMSIVIKAPID